ncbi:MAG: amidase [Ancalomicrobiaceae bacterium]|nr:amidase [Ancalomicrobiaceae bacterium]
MDGVDHYSSIRAIGTAFRSGATSPTKLTAAVLERITALNPGLRAYLTVTGELAMAQAEAAEAELASGRDRGPLHGVPIALKDLAWTKGVPTSAGMAIHREFVPDEDATLAARLATAGAVLLGKLHMTEGATLEHHPELPEPVNPWRPDLWTGVSSSGSGAATAAGLCYASLGSDTGGSIRFPSASNGLTGVKPTWGRVSRFGICDLAPSFDTVGPMARSAADCAAFLSAIAGFDAKDMTSLRAPVPDYVGLIDGVSGLKGVKIGVDWDYIGAGVTPEVLAATERAAKCFADLGAEIVEIAFPDPTPMFAHLLDAIEAELAHVHLPTYPSQANRYGPALRDGLERGRNASALAVALGTIERDKFKGRLREVFSGVDAVLMAVLKQGTPTWDEVRAQVSDDMIGFMRFTALFNAAGSPTVTAPCGFTADGRPIGFQLVGPHLSEAKLLAAVNAYQQATDFHLQRPFA